METGSKIRILIVDDDVDAATGVKDLLELEGYVTAVAHDGNGAKQSAIMMSPQVALVDLRLKGEWGLDVAADLKEQFPNIVNVVMTGESDSGVVIAALRQGIYEYLTKPFEPEELIHVVERAAEKVGYEMQRLKIMDQLKHAKDQAELASRSKTEFLTRLGGEIGGQFSCLVDQAIGIVEQRHGELGDPRYAELAVGIADGCRHLSRVMTWIGELGHLEAGSMRVHKSSFDLGDLIRGISAVFEHPLAEKNLELEIHIDPKLGPLSSDSDHFARILGHLLTNAIKFSSNGSVIHVDAMVDGFGDLRLTIKDHGAGIDPDQLDLALAPFGRVKSQNNPDAYAVGLGLPLADKLTNLLGGKLTVESALGEGTAVELRFSKDRVFDAINLAKSA